MRLADTLSAQTLLEMPEENPFLERFYQNPKQSALPTQLFFLFQRMRQLQGLRQQDMFAPLTISDYLMDKDALFARLNLDDDELALYETVYAQTTIQTPQPDLVVYLHAPTTVLMDRIRRRNRRIEAGISKEYLTKLVDAYTQFFHFYVASPLLIVNTAELDLVGNSNHFQQLVERINATRSGRHYFNPQA
ncbi:deoxynucleoside kinase [Permianibacter aggregans]|nr:deoxynucleoside kinase [Permianibacter aggregans]